MAELVGIAVLFFVLGAMAGAAFMTDRRAPLDTHSGSDDVEARSRRWVG